MNAARFGRSANFFAACLAAHSLAAPPFALERLDSASRRGLSAASPTWVQRLGSTTIVIAGPGGGFFIDENDPVPKVREIARGALFPWFGEWLSQSHDDVFALSRPLEGAVIDSSGRLTAIASAHLHRTARTWKAKTAWIRGMRGGDSTTREPVSEFERLRPFLHGAAVANADALASKGFSSVRNAWHVFTAGPERFVAVGRSLTVCDRLRCDEVTLDTDPDSVLDCGSYFMIFSNRHARIEVRGVAFEFREPPRGETPLACVDRVILTVEYQDSGDTTPWFVRSSDDGGLRASGSVDSESFTVSEAAMTPGCIALATAPDGPRPQRAWFGCQRHGARW